MSCLPQEYRRQPHTIRLAGPWQYEPLAQTVLQRDGSVLCTEGEVPPAGTIVMPSDWGGTLGPHFRGRVRYCRRFGRPSGLATADRVELVVEQVDAMGSVELNDRSLGIIAVGQTRWRYDVTSRLQPRNLLCIDVDLPQESPDSPALSRQEREGLPGGLIGEVRLEIHADGSVH